MNRISPFSTFVLFGRTAIRRMLNRCAALKVPTRKEKATAADAAPDRVATCHRSQRRSLTRRLLGMWLPLAILLGLAMPSLGLVWTLMDSVLLREMRTARVLRIPADDYAQLQNAATIAGADERLAAISKIFFHAYDSPAAWMRDSAKEVAAARFAERGVAAFEPIAADSPWRSTLAYLSPEGRQRAVRTVGGYLTFINFAILCVAFGMTSKNITSTDPSLTWLWQFPVSRRVLFTSKLVEHIVDTPAALFTGGFYATVLWICGASFGTGLGIGLLLGVAAAVAGAALRLATEIVLVQKLGRRSRGTIVALATAAGSFALLSCMCGGNSQLVIEGFSAIIEVLPSWFFWNPWTAGLGTDAMLAGGGSAWWLLAPALAAILAVFAVLLAARLTRSGLACSQDSARKSRHPVANAPSREIRFGIGAWKELMQMRRQPEMLGHVLGTPLIVFALLYFGGYQKSLEAAVSSGTNVVVAILVGAAYLLTIAATQLIGKEIKMLWLLQCQPRPLADILRSKARVWGGIAIGISLPFVGGAIFKMPDETAAIIAGVPLLVTSLWWLAELTFGLTALGASVTNEQTVRFRKSAMLLPALILAVVSLALYSQDWWRQLGVVAMLAILNAAVRQRQLAELAWLSEPVETPPKKLYAMHGLLAFMGFDALMGLIKVILIQNSELSPVVIASIGYCVSAVVVGVICWHWLRSNQFTVQPSLPRGPVLRPVVLGLTASCAVGLVVTLVLRWTQVGNPLPALASSDATRSGAYDKWFLLVLWVAAAPLFEEWIFRGFLYRTLRRGWSVALSVTVTAVLFATLHPVAGCVALLTLGTTTALVAEKTGRLWPSILVHSGYNLMVWLLVLA